MDQTMRVLADQKPARNGQPIMQMSGGSPGLITSTGKFPLPANDLNFCPVVHYYKAPPVKVDKSAWVSREEHLELLTENRELLAEIYDLRARNAELEGELMEMRKYLVLRSIVSIHRTLRIGHLSAPYWIAFGDDDEMRSMRTIPPFSGPIDYACANPGGVIAHPEVTVDVLEEIERFGECTTLEWGILQCAKQHMKSNHITKWLPYKTLLPPQ